MTNSSQETSKDSTSFVTDIDGNIYKTVKIGNRIWMAENLKVTKYNNGDFIPVIAEDDEWDNLTTGACCLYDNNQDLLITYGRLYNWFAVNDKRGIAPIGWHVPDESEWLELEMELGMDQSTAFCFLDRSTTFEGGKMREAGIAHWKDPNKGANNESGFSALPGGLRGYAGLYRALGYSAYFWSSTEYEDGRSYGRSLKCVNRCVYRDYYDNRNGFSVRCVMDDKS